jgi:GAF domain
MEAWATHKDLVIPDEILQKWQSIVNIMADVLQVPVAMINKLERPFITVLRSSASNGKFFREGQHIELNDSDAFLGTYCQLVVTKKAALRIPNAVKSEQWNQGLGSRFGYISYMGLPLLLPDGGIYGTICVVDTRENGYNET